MEKAGLLARFLQQTRNRANRVPERRDVIAVTEWIDSHGYCLLLWLIRVSTKVGDFMSCLMLDGNLLASDHEYILKIIKLRQLCLNSPCQDLYLMECGICCFVQADL